MDAYTQAPFVYPNGNGKGNGNGGNGHSPLLTHRPPLLISGGAITALTNGDADVQEAIGAMLVLAEAQLIGPVSVPQAATLTINTLQRIYQALHLTPKARSLLVRRKLGLAAETNGNGMSPGDLDTFVRANLLQVWDAIERVTA